MVGCTSTDPMLTYGRQYPKHGKGREISAFSQTSEATAKRGTAAMMMEMTQMAQEEGKAVGSISVAPAPWGWLYGFYPGHAHPTSSVLLRAKRLSDADVDKERRGRDAGAILGEEMDVAVACMGDTKALADRCPPTLLSSTQLSPQTPFQGYAGPHHSPGLMLAKARVNWPTKSFLEVLS